MTTSFNLIKIFITNKLSSAKSNYPDPSASLIMNRYFILSSIDSWENKKKIITDSIKFT